MRCLHPVSQLADLFLNRFESAGVRVASLLAWRMIKSAG